MSKLISIFCFFGLLAACHPSPEVIRKVNEITYKQKDKTLTCPQENPVNCAIDTPLSELYDSAINQNKDYVTLLEKGDESLLLRLHMIKSAQKRIDIQTFIWVDDESGHLMLAELLDAAKRGVEVNIIADQLFSMGNTWLLSELATVHKNFNMKLFNPLFNEGHLSPFDFFSAVACCMYNLNRRMHNKLFLVDGKYGITGGRNYNDRYFDWDATFNYRDRDVIAIGNVAQEMQSSFNEFWESPWVVPIENLDDVAYRILNDQKNETDWVIGESKKSRKMVLNSFDYKTIKNLFVNTAIAVDSIEYFSDSPESLFTRSKSKRENYKLMSIKIKDLILSAKDKILLQTPYLVLSKKAYRSLKSLRKNNSDIDITVSTNSLSSTDAFYVYAISFKHKKKYLKKLGLNIFEYKQNPKHKLEMFGEIAENPQTRFGMHAKTIIIDDDVSMIGTHNFDHRSDVLNTESGLIIHSKELVIELRKYIEEDMKPENAWVIAPNKKIPVLSFFSGIIATVSRSLPVLDIWPFRYSSSFDLKEGMPPVSIYHPDFYDNYENVGSFPDVNLSSKQIQTIIISAFAGFAEPVM
ncbi:MAG TPA: phospholipase D family protein [Gammaproteobacteria bacterium]|nr:phospholipase D family protein [Xanthomonadales bacterium]MCB1593672.1 phospholipase D family protein [Xanthomonadales bacterium]HOP21619.1 phospholipase D family protein [Gammaproteobacteria bacterium]HPI95882.1 phospholipase D family protein [Gammaproteobacteria bacterium]HPQ87289.1 phospholipase D family protein [Gammaproteobacteria bacterium]